MPAKHELEFISHHLPPMSPGNYSVKLTQQVEQKGGNQLANYQAKTEFVVQGARFRLDPQDIESVFPPPGSLGEHSNCLPHVVLKRSTLPWERSSRRKAGHGDRHPPWLALLLFDESDINPLPQPQTVRLGQQLKADTDGGYWTWLQSNRERGQEDHDPIQVIDLPVGLLDKLLPQESDLSLLAHVRATRDADGQLIEHAVVCGNRLPAPGKLSLACLVSLEGRYDTAGRLLPLGSSTARFVLLHSWRFSCSAHEHSFTGLLDGLDASRPFKLPNTDNAEADQLLAGGAVPLPHRLRGGSRSHGLYRGPLTPLRPTPLASLTKPPQAADALLQYDLKSGLFDVSRASAWELGRLLTLSHPRVATALLQWKHARRANRHAQTQAPLHAGLAIHRRPPDPPPAIPTACRRWLDDLALLKPLPFNYLVADERLLPPESLRLFDIDPLWIESLWQGVLSLGPSEPELAQELTPPHQISGLLLRSSLVSGWPGLQVDAWAAGKTKRGRDEPLELLRRETLAPNVLLCLFAGSAASVDLHLRPEALHLGLTPPSGTKGWSKRHRRPDGSEAPGSLTLKDKHWRNGNKGAAKRVLNITELAHLIGALDNKNRPQAAQFALQMTEGVPLRRFSRI